MEDWNIKWDYDLEYLFDIFYEELKDLENILLVINFKGNNLVMIFKYIVNISYMYMFNLGEYGFIYGWFNVSWKDKLYLMVWNFDKYLDDMDFVVLDEVIKYIDDSWDVFVVYNVFLKYEF